jgi:autotransporter-associated beta strand protein
MTLATLLLVLSIASSTFADSATWKMSPATGDWNHAANWTPPTVPNGPSDTATFAASNITDVSLSADTEVNGIAFSAGASAFTITVSPFILTISGLGITNNSGITQNFATTEAAQIFFRNSATAGSGTFFTNSGAFMGFSATSTAGNRTFTTSGDGVTEFYNSATAGNGTFTINGGGVLGSEMLFTDYSSAGNGIFIVNAGVSLGIGNILVFGGNSTAHAATIIANDGPGGGGHIRFGGGARGGKSRVAVFGTGNLDISPHNPGNVTIGSIEGDGRVFLGARNLTIGSNNLSTKFSGGIKDGGFGGRVGGSLTKIGTGKLVLSHRNTYTGSTTVKRGRLIVNNIGGSGTGSGPVQVNGETLGGKGTIAGGVTVGTGIGSGAVLSPGYQHGANKLGALTIQSALTFNSDATYEVEVNSSSTTADEVIANGVTINTGAQFSFADLGTGTLPPGTVFTVIDNTAATPIAGTFSNLPDGSTFSSNGNTYQVNYEGGDGNDLTLTVIP